MATCRLLNSWPTGDRLNYKPPEQKEMAAGAPTFLPLQPLPAAINTTVHSCSNPHVPPCYAGWLVTSRKFRVSLSRQVPGRGVSQSPSTLFVSHEKEAVDNFIGHLLLGITLLDAGGCACHLIEQKSPAPNTAHLVLCADFYGLASGLWSLSVFHLGLKISSRMVGCLGSE